MFRGILLKNAFLYDFAQKIKSAGSIWRAVFAPPNDLRYIIARDYIQEGATVCDLCAGNGTLCNYLPDGCTYYAVDASPEFLNENKRRNYQTIECDLHETFPQLPATIDTITMIVSLYHFTDTSLHILLDKAKEIADKVIIVEEIVHKAMKHNDLRMKIANYLCDRPFYKKTTLLTAARFQEIMYEHGYNYSVYNELYVVGTYGVKN